MTFGLTVAFCGVILLYAARMLSLHRALIGRRRIIDLMTIAIFAASGSVAVLLGTSFAIFS